MLRSLLFVALGGAAGSMARYAIGIAFVKVYNRPFPLATFLVNIIGCFLIGLIFGYIQKNSDTRSALWLILATGFCGGFTTFSAFALENAGLLSKQLSITALAYTLASVVIGIWLCRLGITLTT